MTTTPTVLPPLRKKRRRWLRVLLVLAALLFASYYVLTRTAVTRLIVLSRVSSIINANVTADSLSVDADGYIVAENLAIRSKTLSGVAGELFRVRRIETHIGMWRLLYGDVDVSRVTLEEPLLRISQNVETNSFNFTGLRPPRGGGGMREAPDINLHRGIIEIGEHRSILGPSRGPNGGSGTGPDVEYKMLRRVDVAGKVEKSEKGGDSEIAFRQVEAGSRDTALAVSGRYGKNGLALTLDSVKLDDLSPATLPTPLRDAFKQLELEGKIDRVVFEYFPTGRVEANMTLKGVALNLPLEPRASEDENGKPIPLPPGQTGRQLRLLDTSGHISLTSDGDIAHVDGQLTGKVEELPYQVKVHIDGATTAAPFTVELSAKNFELKSKPQIMRYTPSVAQRRLDQFSNPSGMVDAEITISRGEPTKTKNGDETIETAAEIKVKGHIVMREGTAAYERFPYRFEHLAGEFTFDENRIDILSLKGSAPSGAKVEAHGWISPLTDDAACEVNVLVTELPVDEVLERSMGKRKRIVEALFNRKRHQELLDKGLVTTHANATKALKRRAELLGTKDPTLLKEMADLDAMKWPPEFEMGGLASVKVVVTRKSGMKDEYAAWSDVVTIDLPDASLVPEKFPYPIVGKNLRIVKTDLDVKVSGGPYRGLRGGTAEISSSADLQKLDDPNLPFAPDIAITARDVPIDDLFINAIPAGNSMSGARPVPEMLTMLNIDSSVDCGVKVGMITDAKGQPDIGYDVGVTVRHAIARPRGPEGGSSRLTASELDGTVRVTQDDLIVALKGRVTPTTGGEANAAETPVSSADVDVRCHIGLTPPEPGIKVAGGLIDLFAATKGIDVHTHIEDLVSIFSPEGGAAIAAARERYVPSGVIDVDTRLDRKGSEPIAVTVESKSPVGEFTLEDGRMGLSKVSGLVTLRLSAGENLDPSKPPTPPTPATFEFHEFRAALTCDGAPVGTVDAAGIVGTDMKPIPGQTLRLKIADGRFESAMMPRIVTGSMGDKVGRMYREAKPRGLFDADLALSDDGNRIDPGMRVSGFIDPRALTYFISETDIEIPTISGRIELIPSPNPDATETTADGGGTEASSRAGGNLRALRFAAKDWTVTADGSWFTNESGRLSMQLTPELTSEGLPAQLRAALPTALTDMLGELDFDIRGPLQLSKASVSLLFPTRDAPDDFAIGLRTRGRVTVANASMDLGVKISDIAATMDYTFDRLVGSDGRYTGAPTVDLKVLADHFTAVGARATDARVRLSGGPDGALYVPLLSAACHGGAIAGTATMFAPPIGPDGQPGPREFQTDIRFSSIPFASLIDDFKSTTTAAPMPGAIEPKSSIAADATDPSSSGPDDSRGRLDAQLSLGGTVGIPESRRGRGLATVGGAQIIKMPIVVPLVRLTNLELPLAERLDFARAEFFIVGNLLRVEGLSLSSKSVDLFGYGTAELPGLELDLRFRARNKTQFPLLSRVVEKIRNELVSAEVRGTPANPDVKIVTFAGTTRLIDRVIGGEPSEREMKLDEIQKQAERLNQQKAVRETEGKRGPGVKPE